MERCVVQKWLGQFNLPQAAFTAGRAPGKAASLPQVKHLPMRLDHWSSHRT